MAHVSDLPCDGDGVCMLCKRLPGEEEKLLCTTCATSWHVPCLFQPPASLSALPHWRCPDCSPQRYRDRPSAKAAGVPSGLIAAVRAIEADGSLSDREKARRRQELVSGGAAPPVAAVDAEKSRSKNDLLGLLDKRLMCSFCMQLPERPVTTPCGHNFCLNCFKKWVAKGKRTCGKCRGPIPSHMASLPRINSTLVAAIRVAKAAKMVTSTVELPLKVYHFAHNQDRPDTAFTTERAQRGGKANACSGKIFVTVPPDHFGPIPAENDPIRNQGVLVGESWEDRMDCRQWGVHLPHVAGIAGQSDYGAQSVALSGGYQDDEDHGEWFLYTGSGGRDLSGNKRTNTQQSFDQQFEKMNEALRVSCGKGYPVRVVRSHKEKRSSYAPETGVRYDGIYRIEKCWRKVGLQGFKVCRYLFVRCDNEPAPWTSDEHGDRPRPLPHVKELNNAIDIMERTESPAWDFDEKHGWRWAKPPPPSRKKVPINNPEDQNRARVVITKAKNLSARKSFLYAREKLLKEFSCLICRKVMNLPLTTPCAHNFCKLCLEGVFAGQTFVRERILSGGKSLRAKKNVMKCPCCPYDISDFLKNPQVNRELMDVIDNLKQQIEENVEASEDNIDGTTGKSDPVDEETKVRQKFLKTSNKVSQTTNFATNNSKHSPALKQNGVILGSEANGAGSHNIKTYESSNEDNQISNAGSKQSLTFKRKKIKDEKKVVDSKESDDGSNNTEIKDSSGKDCNINLKGRRQPVTFIQKKVKSSSKTNRTGESQAEVSGTAGKSGFVDEETKDGQKMFETSNEVIQTAKISANDRKHSPAPKQNGILLGSESNVKCSQNSRAPQLSNEDDQISKTGSKRSLTCKGKRKENKGERKLMDSKELDDGCSKSSEIKDGNGKEHDAGLKESTKRITRSQKKAKSSSQTNQPDKRNSDDPNMVVDEDCGDCQVQSTKNKQPATYETKERGNRMVNSCKKSYEDDQDNVEVANWSSQNLKTQSKQTVMNKKKMKDTQKERKKCDELNSENLILLDEGNMDCPIAENKNLKTLMRRPLTRSCSAKMDRATSSGSAKMDRATRSCSAKMDRATSSCSAKMDRLTRSGLAKMDQEKAMKNKESTDAKRAMNSKGSKGVKKAKTSKDSTTVKKAVESEGSGSPGSANPGMVNGGKKDHQTPKSKQPVMSVRKRPFTRSAAAKANEKNAKRSKKSGEAQESNNSPFKLTTYALF